MYRDERGIIKDIFVGSLFGKKFGLTYITFNKGAIRGNHFHKKTWQFDFIWGDFEIAIPSYYYMFTKIPYVVRRKIGLLYHAPLSAHAYKALEKSKMLTFVVGERVGDRYDLDTFKLSKPLL